MPEEKSASGRVFNLENKKFSTEMNRFAARKEIKSSLSRTGLATQLTTEAEKVSLLAETKAKAIAAEDAVENAPARLEEARKLEEATHHNQIAITNEASERKLSPVVLDEIRKEEEKAKLRVEEHRGMVEIDKEAYRFEKEIDVKGAFVANVAPIYEVNLLMEQLQKALLDRENWLSMPDSQTKTKMLARLNKNIKMLNGAIDVKGQGLIQGKSWDQWTRINSVPPIDQTIDLLYKRNHSRYPVRTLRGSEGSTHLTEEERESHMHIIGTTGEGKSKFLEWLIRGDIDNGNGVCFLDPSDRGDTMYKILAYCAKKGHKKVLVIDPHQVTTGKI